MYGGTAIGAGLGIGAGLAYSALLKRKGFNNHTIGKSGLGMWAILGGALAAPISKRQALKEEAIPGARVGQYLYLKSLGPDPVNMYPE